MKYSVVIYRGISALSYYLNKVIGEIDDVLGWDIRININIGVGMINWEIYFNFDVDNEILEICNSPAGDDSMALDDIIEMINSIG